MTPVRRGDRLRRSAGPARALAFCCLSLLLADDRYYRSVGRTCGSAPTWDQVIGGGLMLTWPSWSPCRSWAVSCWTWIRADAAEAAEVDRRLDEIAAADAAVAGDAGTPELMRPWWETEPGSLGDRYRHT